MITALLLLPVLAILLWLYWYLLPGRRWQAADTLSVLGVLLLTAVWIWLIGGMSFPHESAMWPEIISMVGAYGILITGLGVVLFWRRQRG
jgi:hypothetical protein